MSNLWCRLVINVDFGLKKSPRKVKVDIRICGDMVCLYLSAIEWGQKRTHLKGSTHIAALYVIIGGKPF